MLMLPIYPGPFTSAYFLQNVSTSVRQCIADIPREELSEAEVFFTDDEDRKFRIYD